MINEYGIINSPDMLLRYLEVSAVLEIACHLLLRTYNRLLFMLYLLQIYCVILHLILYIFRLLDGTEISCWLYNVP